jgi:hypothetical protein
LQDLVGLGKLDQLTQYRKGFPEPRVGETQQNPYTVGIHSWLT